ncbi:NAD(P)-dependent oxidoreductase [Candidatus Woesearchaeota archaeon]|nr:NAD(P)-dependent oxidoreductase [Candidatus Woesearchaeota archaeon]
MGPIPPEPSLDHIIGGASHDKRRSPNLRDMDVIKRRLGYILRGAGYVSTKITRAHKDFIDNYKFTSKVFGELSSLDMQAFFYYKTGYTKQAIVASDEGIRHIRELRKFLGASEDRIVGVLESENPKLIRTLISGYLALDVPPETWVGFYAMDCPCAYDTDNIRFRKEHDGPYGAIMDMNVQESVWRHDPPFFIRNFYYQFDTERDRSLLSTVVTLFRPKGKETHHGKECNFWDLRGRTIEDIILEIGGGRIAERKARKIGEDGAIGDLAIGDGRDPASQLYINREAGELGAGSVFGMIPLKNIWNNRWTAARFLVRAGTYYLTRKVADTLRLPIRDNVTISYTTADMFGTLLTGKPTHFMGEHSNPFFVRDVDDHGDRDFYRLIFRRAVERFGSEEEAFRRLFPWGEELYRLNLHIASVNREKDEERRIPDWQHENGMVDRLNRKLEDYVERQAKRRYSPFTGKYRRLYRAMQADEAVRERVRIPRSYDDEGNFIAKPQPGEDINAAVDYLIKAKSDYAKRHPEAV